MEKNAKFFWNEARVGLVVIIPMPRRSRIEKYVLNYLEKQNRPVTFKELYSNSRFSEQGIRNRVTKLVKEGLVGKKEHKGAGRSRVCFVLSK